MYRILLLLITFTIILTANEKVVLQLKWFHQFQFAGYYAAKEKGFYNEVGLDVEIRQRDLKYNNIQQVINNEAQYGIADSVLLLYRAKKEPVVIISPIFQHSPSVLISLKNNNTDSVYELNNKNMVFYENDTDGFAILAMLKKLGINPIITRGRSKDDYLKLVNKQTDIFPAYLSNEPFYFKQEKLDINIFDPRNYGFDLYGDMLFTNGTEAKNNPDRVRRFKKASLKGWNYALENQDEIINIIHKKYNSYKSIEHLKFEAKAIERVISKDSIPLGAVDKGRIKYIHGLYKDYGLTNAKIDVKDFIFDDYEGNNLLIFSDEEKEYIKNNPILKIPNMKAFPPFSYNKNGKPLGYTIDYMRLMSKYIGVKLEIIQGKTWQEYLSLLKKKELDVIPHIAINDERNKYIDFTNFEHISYSAAIAMRKDDNFRTIKDLENKVLAVQNKTFHHTFLEEKFPKQKLLAVVSTKDGLEAIKKGNADVFIGNLAALEFYIQKMWLSDIKTNRIKGLGIPDEIALHMGVSKGNLILKSILEKVHDLIPYSVDTNLKQKWMNRKDENDKINLSSEETSYLNEKKELNMCIDPNWMPYEKIENGNHIGITSDYIKIFREKLSLPINLIPTIDWIQTVKYGKERKCDFITTMINTKERKEFFNFSKNYLNSPLVIATKINESFINDISTLLDKKFGVVRGYAYKEVLEKKYPNINIVDVKNPEDGLKKVDNGEIFGFIDSLPVVGYEIQSRYSGNLKVAGKIEGEWSFSIATRNDEPLLNGIFSKLIENITLDEHNAILHKWISVKYQESIDYSKLVWVSIVFLIILVIIIYKNKSINEINKQMQNYIDVIDENVLTSSTDKQGVIISASQAFCDISGYTKSELLGRKHSIVRHPDMSDKVFTDIWKTITSGETWKGEIKNRRKDGSFYWVFASISPSFNNVGSIIGYASIRTDITDKKKVEELSITDELTELYNKRYFNEVLLKEINIIKRDEKRIGYIMFDVDHFKQYNDNYGHQKGDEVLSSIGKVLKYCCKRSTDTAFRIGGEEFAIIFHPHFKESAIQFANIVKNAIEDLKIEHEYNSANKYITVSMGVYTASWKKIKSSREIYKLTDDALYKAKELGRNTICEVSK